MPKKVREMSATEIRRLSHAVSKDGKPYNALHAVGGVSGLLLQVTPTSAKSWIYRTRVAGQRRSIGLGGFPDVTLAQARDKARAVRDRIQAGEDPVEHSKAVKRALKAAKLANITFAEAMERFIETKSKEFKNPRQAQQWHNSLTNHALPHIGKVPVREIDLIHVKAVLDPIWTKTPETAKRIQGRMEKILGWAAIHGYRSAENPARWKGYLDAVYPSHHKIKAKGHHEALAVKDLPEFIKSLRKRKGDAARALELLILTAARTNEVIGDRRIGKPGITWQEIDFEQKVWTVPADRMKGGKAHRVPLTDDAVGILEGMRASANPAPSALVFTGPDGGIPSNAYLAALLKRMEVPVTAHGFRSTFKVWCQESTDYPDEVSELALAHVNNDATRAAYARSELIEKRRELMQDWASYCNGKEAGNV